MRKGHRRIVLLVLAALVFGGLVWVPMASAAGENATILGLVRGTGYGFTVNLSGANVELWRSIPAPAHATGFTTTTDAAGFFSMTTDADTPLYYGTNLFLRGTRTNYAPADSAEFSLVPYQVKWATLTLQVNPTAYRGTVKNTSGHPLKWVRVAVAGKYRYTNHNGKWTISGLLLRPGAHYKVTYTKRGYRTVHKHYLSHPSATNAVFSVGTVRMRKR